LTVDDIFSISAETSGLDDSYTHYTPPGQENEVGPVLPPGEAYDTYTPPGQEMGPSRPGGGGSSILGELSKFVEDNKDAIGLGAGALAYWGKTISDNRNASQAADAAEMQRQQKAQDQADAIARAAQKEQDAIERANAQDARDWERKQQLLQEQRDYERETAKQRQADQLALISAQRSGSSGGGGGGYDAAAARAARVSASIKGMKAPTTGIVNSNIWGNAMNTLQRR
jgi:hypothetical protein